MRFSERIRKRKPKAKLQLDSMDDDLRTGLWNVVYFFIFKNISTNSQGYIFGDKWQYFFNDIWVHFYKKPIDEISYHKWDLEHFFKDWFFKVSCFDIYDFIDYLAGLEGPFRADEFRRICNQILETELSAYRFVDKKLSPITDDIELREIEAAIDVANRHKLKGVHVRLESALGKLSDRKEPDYRNSVKESISAVESLCAVISNDPKATLGKALKLIEERVGLHPALRQGFEKIYGYTSNEGGIRHAMIDNNKCDFDDAKYMLVSCSAFVNYLVVKANKAGLIK